MSTSAALHRRCLFSYGAVSVYEGKHGAGDYRVEYRGRPVSHAEMLAMLSWLFRAEDRYCWPGQLNRRMLKMHILRVYEEDAPLEEILCDVDGTEKARELLNG